MALIAASCALAAIPSSASAVVASKTLFEGSFFSDLGMDAAGNFYTFGQGGVIRVDPTGQVTGSTGVPTFAATGFDVGPDGTIFMTNDPGPFEDFYRLYRIPWGGSPQEIASEKIGSGFFGDVAADADGVNVLSSQNQQPVVRRYTFGGSPAGTIPLQGIPETLGTSEANSDIFVGQLRGAACAECLASVQRVSTDGAVLAQFGGGTSNGDGQFPGKVGSMEETADGGVWITNDAGGLPGGGVRSGRGGGAPAESLANSKTQLFTGTGAFVGGASGYGGVLETHGNRVFALQEPEELDEPASIVEFADVPPLNLESNATWKQRASQLRVNVNCNAPCDLAAHGEVKVGNRAIGDLPRFEADDFTDQRREFELSLSSKLKKRIKKAWKDDEKVRAYIYSAGSSEYKADTGTFDNDCRSWRWSLRRRTADRPPRERSA